MSRASSFDIFDTILTRQVGSPESAFLLLGNQLYKRSLIPCTAEAFARIRSAAEHRAFDNAGGLDSLVNLDQIYEEVGFVLHLTSEEWRQLLEIELSLERFLLQPIPAALSLLNQARERGDRILFLSDMYIGTEFIQNLLTYHGLMKTDDRLYVSCDYAQSKHSQKLYRKMLQQEGLAPKSVTHCGNSLWSDIKMAQRSQLKTNSFEQGNLNRYEEILERYVWETEGLSSALAGASRLARLCRRSRRA
jgi:predicted HAD superfamily hydrolase